MNREVLFETEMIQCRDAQFGRLYIDIDILYHMEKIQLCA